MTVKRMTVAEYEARYTELLDGGTFDDRRHLCPYFVYRYFNDTAEDGHKLLYVGCTKEFNTRDHFHKWRSLWRAAYPITRVEIEEYPDQQAALLAETAAIRGEIPCHNTLGNEHWHETHAPGECDPYRAIHGLPPLDIDAEMEKVQAALERIFPQASRAS